jgi:hypothetical protein
MATAVLLERCSAPERVRSITDSGAVGSTHGTGSRARFSNALQSRQVASVLAPVAAHGTARLGCRYLPGPGIPNHRLGANSKCCHSPVLPSNSSRVASEWPAWRAVSLIR